MSKRKLSIFLLCVMFAWHTAQIPAEAFEKVVYFEDAENLSEFIKDEVETHETDLKPGVERALNKQEVFDDEIANFSDEEIKQLNASENISVSTGYFVVSDDKMKRVNRSKVDWLYEKKKKSWKNLFVKKAKAVDPAIYKASSPKTGYLKAQIIAYEYKTKIHVIGTNTWLKQPKNRFLDFYGLSISDSKPTFNLKTQKATYTYTYKDEYAVGNQVTSREYIAKTIDLSSKYLKLLSELGSASPVAIGARVNLKNEFFEGTGNMTHTKTVTIQVCIISADVLKRDSRHVDFTSFYLHGKKKYSGSDLSYNLSVGVKGEVSFGITYTPNSRQVTSEWTPQTNVVLQLNSYCY